MTNEKKQIYTLRITSANRTELVEILYEMLLDYIDEANEAIKGNDRNDIREAFRKSRGCLRELTDSINPENELSGSLLSLYEYVNKELTFAEIKKDEARLENIKKVVLPLKTAYEELSKQDSSEPIMANTQKVVAGYTYSKNNINETMTDQNNRGFYV